MRKRKVRKIVRAYAQKLKRQRKLYKRVVKRIMEHVVDLAAGFDSPEEVADLVEQLLLGNPGKDEEPAETDEASRRRTMIKVRIPPSISCDELIEDIREAAIEFNEQIAALFHKYGFAEDMSPDDLARLMKLLKKIR